MVENSPAKISKKEKKRAKRMVRKQRRTAARRRPQEALPQENKHQTRPELMRTMLQRVAAWFPDRRFLFVADSLYTGESVLRYLPANVDMIGAVHSRGALFELPPQKKPGRGVARKKGKRLPSRDRWAASSSAWTAIQFDQFGLHGSFEYKTRVGLYYKAGRDRPLQFVLSRDTQGQRPTQIYYCTDLQRTPADILSLYSLRWAIETNQPHYDSSEVLYQLAA